MGHGHRETKANRLVERERECLLIERDEDGPDLEVTVLLGEYSGCETSAQTWLRCCGVRLEEQSKISTGESEINFTGWLVKHKHTHSRWGPQQGIYQSIEWRLRGWDAINRERPEWRLKVVLVGSSWWYGLMRPVRMDRGKVVRTHLGQCGGD